MTPRILLKARPTPDQLADRLREPQPEGVELYLDASDIAGEDWLPRLEALVSRLPLGPGFAWLVEGPVRSLDGRFFDLTGDSPANREVVMRVAAFGGRIGAHAACVHLIAPTYDLGSVDVDEARAALARCVPLARFYAEACLEVGVVPTVENVPPVARMREALTMTSSVGVAPEHLAWLGDRVPGLRFTVDTSHAQLYLNAAGGDSEETDLADLCRSMAALSPVRTIGSFVAALSGRIETAHVSDAEGVLGEGLPYGAGSMDLDAAVDRLLGEARWLVTEILEPDPNRSINMRAARERIERRRARLIEAPA